MKQMAFSKVLMVVACALMLCVLGPSLSVAGQAEYIWINQHVFSRAQVFGGLSAACNFVRPLVILRSTVVEEGRMNEYQIGGSLRLLTAVEKTDAFAEFLKTRMVRAIETEDPTELHYLLAQLDDYHSYMWRYYNKLAQTRSERMDPGV